MNRSALVAAIQLIEAIANEIEEGNEISDMHARVLRAAVTLIAEEAKQNA